MYIKYDETGYLEFAELLRCEQPFIFITGGRGTGKTYGAAKYVLSFRKRFLWMRRTQNETDMINKPDFQPFKVLNADYGLNIQPERAGKGTAAFKDMDDPDAEPLGYTCALSTISNMRGFDASDVQVIIYDEFIPERHKAVMRNEADALFNAYETVCRNRELQGKPAVQMVCMANSNRLDNEIFLALGITDICEKMKKNAEMEYIDPEHRLAVFMLDDSPISIKKKDTALYKLTQGTEFQKMALMNDFRDLSEHVSVRRNLNEYKPVATVGELCLYRAKSGGRWYVTRHKQGRFPASYGWSEKERLAFTRKHSLLYDIYLKHKIDFADFTSEALFKRLY